MRRGSALVLAVLVVVACQPTSPPVTIAVPTGTSAAAPVVTAAPLRRLDAADLIAMTLPRAELGPAYQTWPFDWALGGFEENEERARDKSEDPAKERADLERFGRLVAYHQMYAPPGSTSQRIWTIVHVFRDSAGTAGYLAAKVDELKSRRTDFPVDSIGDQAVGFHYKIAGGRDAWRVYVRRGAILAGVGLNGTANDASQELIALARKLDDRVDRGLRADLHGYASAAGGEVSAEQLRLMAAPQADLGVDYAKFGLAFDTAGYQDNEERANTWSPDKDKGLAAFQRIGRVTGYVDAYSSEFFAPIGASPVAGYVHTGVHLLRDAEAARQFLAYEGAQEKDSAGRVGIDSVRDLGLSVGEDAIAVRSAGAAGDIWRVIFRRGRIVGEAFIRRANDHDDRKSELARLAQTLDERIQRVVRGDLRP